MKKWFNHKENAVRGFWLKPPYNRVFIGCDPNDGMTKKTADSFDTFVNVSDSTCNTFEPSRPGQHMHWYPVNEMGQWNLSYLFWIVKVLEFHHQKKHKVYLHCHAGAYRSPSAALLWLQYRGHTPKAALRLCKDRTDSIYRIWNSHGNIPKLKDKMFAQMRRKPGWSLGGITHDPSVRDVWNLEVNSGYMRTNAIKHKYFKPYYQIRSFIRDKTRWMSDFLSGKGWRHPRKYWTEYYMRKYFWSWPLNAEEKPKHVERKVEEAKINRPVRSRRRKPLR